MEIQGTPNESQRTEDWHAERLGRFSCSQFYRLMTEPKSKADKEAGNLSQGAMTYIYECIAECITGVKAKDDFNSKYTDWGIENEPLCKAIYNQVFNCKIIDSQYIPYDFNAGGSPDGMIDEDGLIEVKCPYTITAHLQHKLFDLRDVPDYFWQCIGYLLITGRQWIDFVSYHPAYPPKLQLLRKRLYASDAIDDISLLSSKLEKANNIFETILNSII